MRPAPLPFVGFFLASAACWSSEPHADGSSSTGELSATTSPSTTEGSTTGTADSSGGGSSGGTPTSSGGPTETGSDSGAPLPDLGAMTDEGSTGSVGGCGDGIFPPDQPPFEVVTLLDIDVRPGHFALTDLDDDDDLDLAIGSIGDESGEPETWRNYVAFNLGGASFGPAIDLGGTATQLSSIAAPSLADGTVDIVAYYATPTEPSFAFIRVWRGLGGGIFELPSDYASPAVASWPLIALTDIDGDARQDVLYMPASTLSVHRSTAEETLADAEPLVDGSDHVQFRVDDLDSDGDVDVVLLVQPKQAWPELYVHFNEGDGTFGGAIAVPPLPDNDVLISVSSGDLDGDGVTDLVGGSWFGFGIWLGNGDGTFAEALQTPVDFSPSYIEVADLDQNACADVLISGGYDLYLGMSVGEGQVVSRMLVEEMGLGIPQAGDLDGDGTADIVIPVGYPTYRMGALLSGE